MLQGVKTQGDKHIIAGKEYEQELPGWEGEEEGNGAVELVGEGGVNDNI